MIILSGQGVRMELEKQKVILKDQTPCTKLPSYNSYPKSTTQNKCTKLTDFVFRDATRAFVKQDNATLHRKLNFILSVW